MTTPVTLGSLSLTVHFSDSTTTVFGPSYFTPNPGDPTSWDGGAIGIGGTNPQPVDATLTGTFSPTTIVENDGSVHTIDAGFSTFFSDSPNLMDGDLGIIYATEASGAVPEPAFVSWMLLGTFFLGLVVVRNRHMFGKFRAVLAARRGLQIALFLACVLAVQSQSWAAVTLNAATTPGSGTSGVDSVNVTGSGFPAGPFTAAHVIVSIHTGSCLGPVAAATPAASIIHILGTSYRVHFAIPSGLATGTYYVSISDTADATPFASSNCSTMMVTGVSSGLNACVPTSSLGVNAPVAAGPVTAYVPLGAWSSAATGIKVVQVETGGGPVVPPAAIATAGVANSCAANPVTGTVVCTENSTAVDIITGTTLSATLASSSNMFAGFSGGSCENCGVAMDSLNNRAAIAMGFTPSPSSSAIQFLDLATLTFAPPIPLSNEVSEDILVDPTRALILSPNEGSTYDLIQTTKAGAGTEFGNLVTFPTFTPLTMDSAAEDCATGIGLTVGEFSSIVYLADLTQATFVPGAPGTWSAPSSEFTLTVGGPSLAAGASGVSVAQGSSHLAIVTGEFGGSAYEILQLPSTSGPGAPVPTVLDYAFVPMITCPAPTCFFGFFDAGLDPHTVTAYTSGNNGKAYALMAGDSATALAQVDMACVLALPRTGDGHTVADGDAHECTILIGPF